MSTSPSEVLNLKYLGYGSVNGNNPNEPPPLKFHLGLCFRYIIITAICLLIIISTVYFGRAYIHSLKTSDDKLYSIYIIRRAEASDIPLHACDPPIKADQFSLDKVLGQNCFTKNICGGAFLSERGQARADCISKKLRIKGLKSIFAQNPGHCDDKKIQKRGYQTVLPLALCMNVSINMNYHRGEQQLVSKYITDTDGRNVACSQKNVHGSYLISWNHESVVTLLRELGCTGYRCRKSSDMSDNDYDKMYRIDLSCVSGKFVTSYTLTQDCSPTLNSSIM